MRSTLNIFQNKIHKLVHFKLNFFEKTSYQYLSAGRLEIFLSKYLDNTFSKFLLIYNMVEWFHNFHRRYERGFAVQCITVTPVKRTRLISNP